MLPLIPILKKSILKAMIQCFVCACMCLLCLLTFTVHTSSATERDTTNNITEIPELKTLWRLSNAGDCDALYELLSNYWRPEHERLSERKEDDNIDAKLRELELSAQSGSTEACYMLAVYHYYVKLDVKRSQYYFYKGAELGDPECMMVVADNMLFNEMVADKKDQIRELYLKAAQAGHADAYASLALMYLWLVDRGIDPSQSTEQCEQYLKMAEEADSAMVWTVKGDMYMSGTGRPFNRKEAISCYQKGAQKGDKKAQFIYGRYCLTSSDAESDGICLLKKSAAQRNIKAIAIIGCAYYNGLYNVPQDIEKGILFTQFAAYHGDEMAQLLLGQILYEGKNVPQNKELGIEWIKKSAIQGCPEAQRIMQYYQSTK